MKPTEMPARKLTADCIWNSFRSSGKRHLLLTGSRGSGKSTLLSALTGNSLPGITTWAVPGEAVYLRENGTGREERIGRYDGSLPGAENKMRPLPAGFMALGIPALRNCLAPEREWISVDEIGYLELSCPEYCRELAHLLETKRVAAVVRGQQIPFLQSLLTREDSFRIDLDRPFGNFGCVIMASGLGKRFGGNKLMAPFRGSPLIAGALDATEGLFAKRVVVTRNEEVAAYCRERNAEVIFHSLPYRSDTVRLGMEAMAGTDGCVFCQGDQPLLSRETVMSLILGAQNTPGTVWRAAWQGEPGAPIVFPTDLYDELLNLPEGKGGGYTAKMHPERVRLLPVRDARELMDVDTREDLKRLSGEGV